MAADCQYRDRILLGRHRLECGMAVRCKKRTSRRAQRVSAAFAWPECSAYTSPSFCLDLTYLYGRLVKRFSGDRSDFVDHGNDDDTAQEGEHVVRHFMQM